MCTMSYAPMSSGGGGSYMFHVRREMLAGSQTVGGACSRLISKPSHWASGLSRATSRSHAPVPVATSAMRPWNGTVMEGCIL